MMGLVKSTHLLLLFIKFIYYTFVLQIMNNKNNWARGTKWTSLSLLLVIVPIPIYRKMVEWWIP